MPAVSEGSFEAAVLDRLRYVMAHDRRQRERRMHDEPVAVERRVGERRVGERRSVLRAGRGGAAVRPLVVP
jgi:hypothetical protein